ncbi:efflux RND transporter permease subunit [Leptospira jelokensis]|uniref:efflux RND transporter permease subunit n=1 Tax=Leptospira jelokensis TaxID=2484931 RepID=UPI0010846E2C|nr:efflux RND transporter permease subunit [Leptospira jelokensis]
MLPPKVIHNYRYQLISFLVFLAILSIFHSNQFSFEDGNSEKETFTLEISQHWPGKSALQIEGQIAKPWEMVLKTVSGYKERQFVSDHGVFKIYLQIERGNSLSEFIQTIRNVYILNQNRFPNDVLFPRFQSKEDQSSFFIVLENKTRSDLVSEKELEITLRNWYMVLSVNFQSGIEKELVTMVNGSDFQTDQLPALSEVFQTLKRSQYGFGKEVGSGRISVSTIPNSLDGWAGGILLENQKSPEWMRNLLQFRLVDSNKQTAVRVNGEPKSTVMVYAKSAFHLLLLEIQLQSLLKDHSQWEIIMVSKQGYLETAKELLWLFLVIDLFSFVFLGFYQKNWFQFLNFFFVFYLTILYYLFLSSAFHLTLGNLSFIIFLFFKLHLPYTKRLRWKLPHVKLILIFIFFGVFVSMAWVPFLVLKLVFAYYFLLFLSQVLFRICECFSNQKVFRLARTKEEKFLMAFEGWSKIRKQKLKLYQVVVSFFVLILSAFCLLYDCMEPIPMQLEDGFFKYAKLEFPNYVAEAEVYRITKQVESKLIDGNWTDLLIVIPKPYRSEFYFQSKSNGLEIPFQNLPTELGYFHVVEGNRSDSQQILRFTQMNMEKLEKDLLQLVPWLQYKKEVTDVVLCFQPSVEGLEFRTNSFYRALLGNSQETTIKEDMYTLQSNIVGKFLWKERLVDIKFQVNHSEHLDSFLKQQKKMPLNQTLFDSSIRDYAPVKILNRFYQINGKPTLELMIKGENINWPKLESEIREYLKQTDSNFYERISSGAPVPLHSISILVLIFALASVRKKEIFDSFLRIYCILLISKLQITLFGGNYIQFVWILIFIVTVDLTSGKRNLFKMIFSYQFLLSFIFLLLYPANVGNFLFSTVCLVLLYGTFYIYFSHSFHFLKPRF